MNGELLEDWDGEDVSWKKGEVVEVIPFDKAVFNYMVWKDGDMDLIPKSAVKII